MTLGDPTPEASVEVLRAVIRAGADALSLTLPFSDPCAHAPDCAHASVRALEAGADLEQSLRLVRTIRDEYPDLPVMLTLYANQIVVLGLEAFTAAAADAGVDASLHPGPSGRDARTRNGIRRCRRDRRARLGRTPAAQPPTRRASGSSSAS